jgi:hypothetical protein
MESRQSGRADGRGWGGRGDANPRRGAARNSATRPDDERLRGPAESPWVRLEDPGPGPSAHSGSPPGVHSGPARGAPPLPDLSALLVVLEGVRGMVPRELSSQVNALVRELLLTLRALIDWYLERLDGGSPEPEVEEIPID